MISCEEFQAELGNYLENDTAAEIRRQLEDHLAHCRICQVLYDSVRKTIKIVADSGSFDLPDGFSKQITTKIMSRIRGTAD